MNRSAMMRRSNRCGSRDGDLRGRELRSGAKPDEHGREGAVCHDCCSVRRTTIAGINQKLDPRSQPPADGTPTRGSEAGSDGRKRL